MLAGTCFALIALHQAGIIKLPHLNVGSTGVYELASTPVRVPYSYDFSGEMIPFLGPENDSPTHSFYLGSGVGFPPTGLILDINGVLKGVPSIPGYSKFQVCVKDVGGHSYCRTYSLTVTPEEPEGSPQVTPTPTPNCPTRLNPPCGSGGNGKPTVSGGIVPADCGCPSGSTFASMDYTAPGGPYRICVCD